MERLNDYPHENGRTDGQQTPPPPPPGDQPSPPPGYQAPPPVFSRRDLPFKSTAFAIVLSVIIPSLGHIYLGFYKQAFTIMLVFASVIMLLTTGSGLEPLLGIMLGFLYFYQIFDAGRRASLYNRVLETGQAGLSPEQIEIPETNPFAGGVIMVVIGSLALLNTLFDFSMYWLADWWPVIMIVLGVWLIRKGRTGRKDDDSSV